LPITDPKVKIHNLLTANWNESNTSGVTPRIHMGWYNPAWEAIPQVTITAPIYTARGGGETGVSAIAGDGDSVRVMIVTMMISCWAHHNMSESDGTNITVNPRQLTYEMANEIKRIIETNMFTDSELDWVNWIDMVEQVELRIKPILFRYDNTVRLLYREAF
jgi:hypothetical protein